jgi:hypothetical protein
MVEAERSARDASTPEPLNASSLHRFNALTLQQFSVSEMQQRFVHARPMLLLSYITARILYCLLHIRDRIRRTR